MNFTVLDWVIFIGLFVLLTSMSFFLKRFAKGVAGFLVAGRNVGRYLGLESDSMAGLGAVTILALWQMVYSSGFVGILWYLLMPTAAAFVALTGFAIYRFRQTRAMTLGQFVEMRYSKKTRILFGIAAFTAGVINMGVFPAAGAHFFVNYCGLPDRIITTDPVPLFAGIVIPGLEISLMATAIMLVLVTAAVIICFNGGQVTLIVTNFVQALFVNVMLITIMFAIYKMFTWEQFAEAYLAAVDLSAVNLSAIDLSKVDLSVIDLSAAYLSSVDLSAVDLSAVDLSSVDLSAIDLSSVDLSAVNISAIDLSSVELSADYLTAVDLSAVNLSALDLSVVDLSAVNLSAVDLSAVDLSVADLSALDLSTVNLSAVNLSNVDLSAVDLSVLSPEKGKPMAETLLHPFSSQRVEGFDKTFFMIGIFTMAYWVISWAPNTLVTSSASGAHEAKMMRVMVEIKKLVYVGLGIGVLPLAVFVLMNHPDFADKAAAVQNVVDNIPNKQIGSQMMTPAALQFIVPKGILGAFAGFVLFAFLSTHTSYLLAWGGGLIQDVVIPIRGKALEPKKHMKFIRTSVLCVAVYIVLFSTFFKQQENLLMFLALTGGIYLSSAVILIGGLYWKRGTTKAAICAMIAGVAVSIVGLTVTYGFVDEEGINTIIGPYGHKITLCVFIGFCVSLVLFGLLNLKRKSFIGACVSIVPGAVFGVLCMIYREKINPEFSGKLIMFHASLISIAVYLIVSELTSAQAVNYDKMFNRSAEEIELRKTRKWWQFGPEVPKSDRILIPCIYGGIFTFVVAFVGTWIYCTRNEVSPETWLKFWHVFVYTMFILGVAFMIWVITGGFRDLFRMFKNLKSQEADESDDGSV